MQPINTYEEYLSQHTQHFNQIKSKFNFISFFRLLVGISFFAVGYLFFKTSNPIFAIFSILALISFAVLLKVHTKIAFQRKLSKALIDINQKEIAFLKDENNTFDDGLRYTNHGHAYSFDLDFFGHKSVFHILNRTATFIGSKTLAKNLQTLLPQDDIIANQLAIRELAKDTKWRQEFQALAVTTEDNEKIYKEIDSWTKTNKDLQSKSLHLLSYLLPALFLGLLTYTLIFDADLGNLVVALFFVNLAVLANQLKTIKKELLGSTKVDEIMKTYSLLLQKIEKENFEAVRLNTLKSKLKIKNNLASTHLRELSNLFGQLENILNPVGAIFLNGFFLTHIHTLRNFRKWKNQNAENTLIWLSVIGEIEALNCLANFSYNNPEFTFPELNVTYEISFENLGHPLLPKQKRVTSSVSFANQKFILLTGSNMSGKSTFLRSLGINMVLAGIGAPVCASKACFHPIPVFVSMRISDSLNDSESLFFAEVKRLKEVMDAAEKETCFVLLDEILRGTNSDDKRTGTVEVVKKIIAKSAIGAIATHDLKVCETTADFPNYLTNKCFEVEIVNNELFFDYQLREGICKNKSATFLMKKMGVI